MAGRGVDIILGGSPEQRPAAEWSEEHDAVVALGGLYVVGTEHHEARRIDNQLRGRAGRQGDPGSTLFFVSLDDEIMRRFGGERVKSVMQWAGLDENTPIEHPMVTKAIANAQVQTEGYHFDIRKHLVEYDDVLNKHREVMYERRRQVLNDPSLTEYILGLVDGEMALAVDRHVNADLGEGDREGLIREVSGFFPLSSDETAALFEMPMNGDLRGELTDRTKALAREKYDQREQELGVDVMRMAERAVMLHTMDRLWVEHLTALERMRLGIGLRAVAQQQPLVAYKMEGRRYFDVLEKRIRHDVPEALFHVAVKKQPATSPFKPVASARSVASGASGKVGRNDPCPCGSGKKYKHCCGK
jgi:preprotein translocase subunit SecA